MLQTKNAGWTSRHTRAWGCRESSTVPADATTQHLTQNEDEETDDDNVHHNLSRLHLLVRVEKKYKGTDKRHDVPLGLNASKA